MGTLIKGKPYQPVTPKEIRTFLDACDHFDATKQYDLHVIYWQLSRKIQRLIDRARQLTDDEFDLDQYSQEQGDGFIY